MADTDIETLQNGTATLSLEEEERLKQRPADIDADVREMERRKRVEALMSSKLFREELERVLDQQMHEGGDAPLLQRIREMVGGRLHSGSLRALATRRGRRYYDASWLLFTGSLTCSGGPRITARLNTAVESVLTTPRGLLPHEVTASSLVKVDMQGAVQDQGTTNFPVNVLILSNSGALCCGATLEEAFHHARLLTAAADVQLRLASIPLERLALIDDETRRQIYEAARKPPNEQGKWRVGGEEFEALMRMLDNAGFRTGYIYRHPLIKKGQGKTGERTRWLNSPNVYQKVEVLETGTHDPKKITKWVQDGSPAHSSTPVKIDTLQFVPMKTNPKEFKKLQQQIKENRRADKISAGPQSHILEGVTWDEASKLHNATVYSAPYARNPFDHVTDNEIEDYKRAVERKRRGNDYDTDLSESEAISGAQITSPAIDTTDFLNAERSHADRTKDTRDPTVLSDDDVFLPSSPRGPIVSRAHHRDPNLLSDDEVFLDSAASTVTSSTGLISPPPRHVVIRAQTTAVAQSVRGMLINLSHTEVSSIASQHSSFKNILLPC
ncbi:Adducin [Operophtera brumata]|uniref:Adducin n=1 Tax=Operophtera brumata TaxID=104452 RepID=A0A0L7LFE3_OPEBR|nr:Adducin [Operophtera brumata]